MMDLHHVEYQHHQQAHHYQHQQQFVFANECQSCHEFQSYQYHNQLVSAEHYNHNHYSATTQHNTISDQQQLLYSNHHQEHHQELHNHRAIQQQQQTAQESLLRHNQVHQTPTYNCETSHSACQVHTQAYQTCHLHEQQNQQQIYQDDCAAYIADRSSFNSTTIYPNPQANIIDNCYNTTTVQHQYHHHENQVQQATTLTSDYATTVEYVYEHPVAGGHQFVTTEADGEAEAEIHTNPDFERREQQLEANLEQSPIVSEPDKSSTCKINTNTKTSTTTIGKIGQVLTQNRIQQHGSQNQCQVCGRNYARPSTLKTHLRTHTNERPFKCLVCLKTFSQAANLTAHRRVHTGERPFACPTCGRQFSQSSSVITHLRTHSGERPYRCHMCNRTFSDSSTLTKHCRIHSGEKPYQCPYCPLNFSQSGNLSRHLKLHYAMKPNR